MKPNKYFITNYRKAWLDYKGTIEYKSASTAMKKKGIMQPYRDNILMNTFAAGWNATNAPIFQIEDPLKRKA